MNIVSRDGVLRGHRSSSRGLGRMVLGLACALSCAPAAAQATAYFSQPVSWGECWFASLVKGSVVECATISVPRDWAQPGVGTDLKVAISRVRASKPAARKGILMTNPGGPGGSGVLLAPALAQLQPGVAERYDIIGMDPRGVASIVGTGSTSLTCDVDAAPLQQLAAIDSRDLSDAASSIRQRAVKAVADGCAKNPLTPYINTWQTAHDLELLRRLLGEDRLNYLGFSYGTWLGAKYAALFPSSAGKIVLDSNTAWMDQLSHSWQLMPLAFQRRWHQQFAPWIVRSPVFSKYVGGSVAEVDATYEATRAAYIKYSGVASAGSVIDALWRGTLYNDAGFVALGLNLALLKVCLVDNTDLSVPVVQACAYAFLDRIMSELEPQASEAALAGLNALRSEVAASLLLPEGAVHDPVGALVESALQAQGSTVPVSGTHFAVRCGDGGQWHTLQYWRHYASKYGPSYPLAGYAIPMEVCSAWSLPTRALPNPDASKLPPILTVQSEFDAATGFESTVRNLAQMAGLRFIGVEDAGSHGQYAAGGNSCVDEAVNRYLLDDIPPSLRTICGATALPMETTAYPATGPLDSDPPPRAVPASLADPHMRRLLQGAIAGKQLTRPKQ